MFREYIVGDLMILEWFLMDLIIFDKLLIEGVG